MQTVGYRRGSIVFSKSKGGTYVHLFTGVYEKYGVRYQTLTLTDGAYALTVAPEKGGMAISFQKDGDEYLWLRDKNFESTDRTRCGIPILFPSCSKPEGGVHMFGGQAYPIEIHGFADPAALVGCQGGG